MKDDAIRTPEDVAVLDDVPVLFPNYHVGQVYLARWKVQPYHQTLARFHEERRLAILESPAVKRMVRYHRFIIHGLYMTIGKRLTTYAADFEDGLD